MSRSRSLSRRLSFKRLKSLSNTFSLEFEPCGRLKPSEGIFILTSASTTADSQLNTTTHSPEFLRQLSFHTETVWSLLFSLHFCLPVLTCFFYANMLTTKNKLLQKKLFLINSAEELQQNSLTNHQEATLWKTKCQILKSKVFQ